MVTVPWSKLSEPAYAQLVSLLLQRMMPTAEVLDGSGGDGGRDVQVRQDGLLTLYELKHFTGRLSRRSPSRQPQVEKSLAQATKLRPKLWHLVVPIDHNPSELKWFDGLREQYPFVCQWLGLSWLNTQLSAYPDLVRSVLNTVNDELLTAIGEYRAERDMLAGGVPDLVRRTSALQARADEMSQHYRVQVTQFEDRREVAVFAKHERAMEMAPITVGARFVFPDTPEGLQALSQFHEMLHFGQDLDLDASSLHHSLSMGRPSLESQRRCSPIGCKSSSFRWQLNPRYTLLSLCSMAMGDTWQRQDLSWRYGCYVRYDRCRWYPCSSRTH